MILQLVVLLGSVPTPTPFPVEITKGAPDSAWAIVAAIASVAAATITAVLAFATVSLARQTKSMAEATAALAQETKDSLGITRDGVEQNERHHRETLMPIVVLSASFRIDRKRGAFTGRLFGDVRNIGGGPSATTTIILRPDGLDHVKIDIGPLAANSTVPLDHEISVLVQRLGPHPFTSELEYVSVFSTKGISLQRSRTGHVSDLKQEQGSILPEPAYRDDAPPAESVPVDNVTDTAAARSIASRFQVWFLGLSMFIAVVLFGWLIDIIEQLGVTVKLHGADGVNWIFLMYAKGMSGVIVPGTLTLLLASFMLRPTGPLSAARLFKTKPLEDDSRQQIRVFAVAWILSTIVIAGIFAGYSVVLNLVHTFRH